MQEIVLQLDIIWPAFLVGLLILVTHITFGREVLQRGIIFLDLAIAQIAAFGVVIANTLWFGDNDNAGNAYQTVIAIIAAITGSMCLYQLRHLEIKVQEAIIGILFILAATGSILLLSADPHGGERLKEILVGQILWVQINDVIHLAIAYGIILALWFKLRPILGAWIFYPLFATTITLSTQVVGVYLVFASLIIPCLATIKQQNPLRRAFVIGTVGYAGGLLMSALFDLPAGAAIVWCLSAVALIYFVVSYRYLRHQ